ncbi:MAG: radical SAM protein [Eubacteriales bacterium]
MKVLLINPKISLDWARSPTCPLGLLSIASYLIEKGHTVKIFDHMVSSENIENYIKAFSPDIVGLSVISPMASADAIKISKFAKKLNIPVVWGGHITSALPELVFKEGCVDFIVIGEGEITFTALLDSIENGSSYYDVDGLAFVDNYGIHINKCREFSDLSTFPIIDWSLVDPRKYFQFFFGCKKMIYVYFSKGCPAKCTFCNNPNFHRSTHRKRPPEHIVSEIEYLYKNYGIDAVNFADEYWNPGKENLQKFLHLMKERNLNIMWGIQTRLGTFSKEELKQMHDAGCRWVL